MCENGHHIIYWKPAGATCACGEFRMPGMTGSRIDEDPTIARAGADVEPAG